MKGLLSLAALFIWAWFLYLGIQKEAEWAFVVCWPGIIFLLVVIVLDLGATYSSPKKKDE